jgi:hypothetical protein
MLIYNYINQFFTFYLFQKSFSYYYYYYYYYYFNSTVHYNRGFFRG